MVQLLQFHKLKTVNTTVPNIFLPARLEDLTVMLLKIHVFWDVMSAGKQIGQLLISQLGVPQRLEYSYFYTSAFLTDLQVSVTHLFLQS
jgi:hypothetical protein